MSNILKDLRKQHKLTLAQVAERTGISVSYISDLELSKLTGSVRTLQKLACCYGVSVEALLGKPAMTKEEMERQERIRLFEDQAAFMGLHAKADIIVYDTDGVMVQAIYTSPMQKAKQQEQKGLSDD